MFTYPWNDNLIKLNVINQDAVTRREKRRNKKKKQKEQMQKGIIEKPDVKQKQKMKGDVAAKVDNHIPQLLTKKVHVWCNNRCVMDS